MSTTPTQHSGNIAQTILSAVAAARIPPLVLALPLALVTVVFSLAVVATIQARGVSGEPDESFFAADDIAGPVSYRVKIRRLQDRIAELERLVPVQHASLVPVAREEPYAPTTLDDQRNIFERYSDSLLQPAENCREWETVDDRVKRVLTDAGRHFGGTVLMLSCYRSAAYNRAIYQRMKRKPTKSQHILHKAIDAKIAGISSIKLAGYVRSHPVMKDIGGVGTYCSSPGMVHVDVGAKRNWHWACHKARGKTRLAKRNNKMRFAKRHPAKTG
jgi:hypothetical protein